MILRGKLNVKRLIIVGVYAPNKAQAPYWEEIYYELLKDPRTDVLMLGDINVVPDSQFDRTE